MSIPLVVTGNTYNYPVLGDENWGTDATNWAAAVTAGMLQKSGGSFTLTADANFGSSFGLLGLYFTSVTANPSATGVLRLAKSDTIGFRNNANGADISISLNSSDQFSFGAPIIGNSFIPTSSTVPVNGLYLPGANSIGFATNTLIAGSISSTQGWTIGANTTRRNTIFGSDSTINGSSLLLKVSTESGGVDAAGTFQVCRTVNDGVLQFSGAGGNLGARMQLFGSTHATRPNVTQFLNSNGSSLTLDGNANAITLRGFGSQGYQTNTPANGATVTCNANIPGIYLTPVGTIAGITLLLPSSPFDGQQFWVASSQIITTVTFQDASGNASNVVGGQATLGGTSPGQRFFFNGSAWFNIG